MLGQNEELLAHVSDLSFQVKTMIDVERLMCRRL